MSHIVYAADLFFFEKRKYNIDIYFSGFRQKSILHAIPRFFVLGKKLKL